MKLSITPTPETATETKMKAALRLITQFQTLIAMLVPLLVAVWAGFTIPGRLSKVEAQVTQQGELLSVLVAAACLRAPAPTLETIKLRCDEIVQQVQQAGRTRPNRLPLALP